MKLRCMFAAHALSVSCGRTAEGIAKFCWQVSDAMIKEMKHKEGQWREEEIMSRTQMRIDVGEGYRQLDLDEPWLAGDEAQHPMLPNHEEWFKLSGGGARVRELDMIVRRKVVP